MIVVVGLGRFTTKVTFQCGIDRAVVNDKFLEDSTQIHGASARNGPHTPPANPVTAPSFAQLAEGDSKTQESFEEITIRQSSAVGYIVGRARPIHRLGNAGANGDAKELQSYPPVQVPDEEAMSETVR